MVSVISGGMGTRGQEGWEAEVRGEWGPGARGEWGPEARGEWGPEARGEGGGGMGTRG